MNPGPLSDLLQNHRRSHAVHFPPNGHTDHGPMAYLALHGLGLDFGVIERFAGQYRRKLAPLPPSRSSLQAGNWRKQVGHSEAYPALLDFFDREVLENGWREAVTRHLPALLSGWVKDAFHGLIRLGYGIEFEVDSEVAAGLAYLACIGDDPELERAAARDPRSGAAAAHLEALQDCRAPAFSEGAFNQRLERVLRAIPVAPLALAGGPPRVVEALSRTCLDVFDASHDFFALHTVTGSHAFRVCQPFAGSGYESLYSAGIAAAYLAIGAPAFARVSHTADALPIAKLALSRDEHDIKIAYTCRAQTRAYSDASYESVASHYLASRV